MKREPILRHVRPLGKARRNHPPTRSPLQCAETKDRPQACAQAAPDPTVPEEPQERQQKRNSDRSPKQAMCPLPPEYRFEFRKAHAPVELLILRDCFVFLEFGLQSATLKGGSMPL